ncbi:MAG: helix-turn-helix transcriptional regulator, partial [Candidatus Kapaibacterium sp.]
MAKKAAKSVAKKAAAKTATSRVSAPEPRPSSSEMLRRVLHVMSVLSTERLTTAEVEARVLRSEEFREVSRRTIQRDLRALSDAGIVDCFDAFGAPEWFVHKEFANIVPTRFTNHEIISMYVLKSYLHQFRNTAIAKDTESLLKKLENAAQGEEVVSMSLEHAFGQYHYDYDNTMIERVVEKIRLRSSMSVTYRNAAGQVKTYDVQLCRVFHYNGELYVAAYIFKHSTYSTLALRNIQQLEDSAIEYPAHRFNEQEFLRTRFGVYHGTPVDITLQVRADMSEFFR